MTRAHRCRSARLVVLAVGLLGLTSGCSGVAGGDGGPAVVVHTQSGPEGPYAGLEIEPGYPMPTVRLTDDAGRETVVPDDLTGTVHVFFYGYTQCPDVCGLIMSELSVAVARLPEAAADDVDVVLVTSDPARDDPAALRAYLDRFDPDFTGLTGPLDSITAMAETMGVPIESGRRLPSGGYEVAHGTQVVGYAGGRGVVVWPEGTSAADIAADLVLLSDQEG